MTRRRWIADQVSGDRAYLLGRNAEHLARVLRARVGQEFEISTGEAVRLGRVLQVGEDRVEFSLGEMVPQGEAARMRLLLAVFKFDRMEWAIEKATELGAAEIIPVIARRTESHLARASGRRAERWRRIAHEAAQQSRRVTPPEIRDPQPLKTALLIQSDLRVVLAEGERGTTLKELLARNSQLVTSDLQLALAIGPEGGWTDHELSAFTDAGWTSATLGPTILRAETAAIAALAIAMSELS
jgi:16S rRNA (uracil1498-N3)-methyltransferase